MAQAAPPPLPAGDRGFVPQVGMGRGVAGWVGRQRCLFSGHRLGPQLGATQPSSPPAPPTRPPARRPQCVEGTKTGGAGPPGFPSLTTIKAAGELRKAGVNVFGMASRKESLILMVKVGVGEGWVERGSLGGGAR